MRLFARISMVACYIGRLLGQPYNILPTSLESRPILFYKILQWLISVYHYQYSYFCIFVFWIVFVWVFDMSFAVFNFYEKGAVLCYNGRGCVICFDGLGLFMG